MVSKLEILKEVRHAGKHVSSFKEQILNFTKDYIVENDEIENRREAWNHLKEWMNKNLPS